MSKTFEQWSDDGYKIKKGSKSASRNDQGVPTFFSDQVEKKNMQPTRTRNYAVQADNTSYGGYGLNSMWLDDDIPF